MPGVWVAVFLLAPPIIPAPIEGDSSLVNGPEEIRPLPSVAALSTPRDLIRLCCCWVCICARLSVGELGGAGLLVRAASNWGAPSIPRPAPLPPPLAAAFINPCRVGLLYSSLPSSSNSELRRFLLPEMVVVIIELLGSALPLALGAEERVGTSGELE